MKKRHNKSTIAELTSEIWGAAFQDYEGEMAVFVRLPPIVVRMLRKLEMSGDDILLVSAVMAHRSASNPTPYVTTRTLGYWVGLPKSTVAERMKRLVTRGLITLKGGGPGVSNRYDPSPLLARLVEQKAELFNENVLEEVLGQMFPLPDKPDAASVTFHKEAIHRWELNQDGLPQGSSAMALAVQDLYAGPDRPRTPAEHDRAWLAAQVALGRDFSGYAWEERQRRIAEFVLAQYKASAP